MRLTAWIAQHETSFVAARGEAIRTVLGAFDAAGIAMPEPTYRLITQDALAEAPVQPTTPNRPALDPQEQLDVDVRMENELEAIVEDERAEQGADDLLAEAAPKE